MTVQKTDGLRAESPMRPKIEMREIGIVREIRESIARFYAGCAKGIAPCMRDSDVPANECQWAIVWPDGSAKQGQALPGVRLISKRGRFLSRWFENRRAPLDCGAA